MFQEILLAFHEIVKLKEKKTIVAFFWIVTYIIIYENFKIGKTQKFIPNKPYMSNWGFYPSSALTAIACTAASASWPCGMILLGSISNPSPVSSIAIHALTPTE